MRLLGLVLVMISCACFGQETTDTTSSPFYQFQQEGLLSNRSLWTFEDNPALAGFDRKLNVTYDYTAQNLGITVPGENGYQQLAFQQHAAMVDLAFGGQPQNWGVGVAYRHIKEGFFEQHKAIWAHSFRVKMGHHRLLFGLNGGLIIHSQDWSGFTFYDQIDPRMGIVYPTNEQQPVSEKRFAVLLGGGLIYLWRRLRIEAVYQSGPFQLYSYTGGVGSGDFFRGKAVYFIKVDKNVSIAPEMAVFNTREGSWVGNPAITVLFKNLVFGQISLDRFNQIRVGAGYFFKESIGVMASYGSYLRQENFSVFGPSFITAGIRYQIPIRK